MLELGNMAGGRIVVTLLKIQQIWQITAQTELMPSNMQPKQQFIVDVAFVEFSTRKYRWKTYDTGTYRENGIKFKQKQKNSHIANSPELM